MGRAEDIGEVPVDVVRQVSGGSTPDSGEFSEDQRYMNGAVLLPRSEEHTSELQSH